LSEFRYKAFISYSHRDEFWGRWLQSALEKYRVSRHLVGKEGEFGKIPARLSPVFRDREDLSTATNLTHSISQELSLAETMIVVCSPASAQSRWVNEEIRHFQSLGRGDRIYALIVDGEPGASDPAQDCFPVALVTQEDGSRGEPLAADVRKWADGKLLAKLKLISAILGIRLDDLRRRDMQRRHRLWMASSMTALLVAVVTTVLAIVAMNARNAAENRRDHAEDLVGYMVGDLHEKLATVGRLDILDSMGGQVTDYLETLDPGEVTDESLNQQAKVWRQLGEVSRDQGNFKEAMEAFTRSRDVLAELYRRQADNSDRLFELGQAEFWVGYINLDLGDLDAAERGFTHYMNISNQLLELEPGSAAFTMEVSYAMANMGWLERSREGADPEKILIFTESSLDFNRKAVMLDSANSNFREALLDSYANLADAHMGLCKLGPALLNRQRNVELAAEFFQASPGDSKLKDGLAYAKSGLGGVERQVGMIEQSLANLSESETILDELSRQDPSNQNYRYQKLMRTMRIASIYGNTGEQQRALGMMAGIAKPLSDMNLTGDYSGIIHAADYSEFLENYSELAHFMGDALLADVLLEAGLQHASRLVAENPDHVLSHSQLLQMAFQYWQQNGRLPGPEVMALLDTRQADQLSIKSCSDAVAAVKLALMTGDQERASEYTSYLLHEGYFEPRFVRLCERHDLCEQ